MSKNAYGRLFQPKTVFGVPWEFSAASSLKLVKNMNIKELIAEIVVNAFLDKTVQKKH